jgi:hypothetical protein
MFYDIERPEIALLEWERFCEEFPPHLIEEVIGRDNVCLMPYWFMPLAWGVAIASDELLREAGHRHGMRQPPGWRETTPHYFKHVIDGDDRASMSFLLVRESEETGLWTIERLGPSRRGEVDEVLGHIFGGTPLFTRSYQSAMCLAMHCHTKEPPPGLRWIKGPQNDVKGVSEFAKMRRFDERYARYRAQVQAARLHIDRDAQFHYIDAHTKAFLA